MKDELSHDAGDDAAATPQVSESNAEVETLRKENEKLRSEIRATNARAALTAELTVAGARVPELLIAAAEKEIQFNDENNPVNVAAVIAKLTQTYPAQFGPEKPASIDAGAGRSNLNNFLTRDTLRTMKPQEIARLDWDEVRTVLSNG
jgi:hypothetical protein